MKPLVFTTEEERRIAKPLGLVKGRDYILSKKLPIRLSEFGNFMPIDTGVDFDPTKPPPFYIGGSMAGKK